MFQDNSVWDIISVTHKVYKSNTTDNGVLLHFTEMEGTIVIKRHEAMFAIFLILPGILLSLISSIMFLLPPEDDTKTSTGNITTKGTMTTVNASMTLK